MIIKVSLCVRFVCFFLGHAVCTAAALCCLFPEMSGSPAIPIHNYRWRQLGWLISASTKPRFLAREGRLQAGVHRGAPRRRWGGHLRLGHTRAAQPLPSGCAAAGCMLCVYASPTPQQQFISLKCCSMSWAWEWTQEARKERRGDGEKQGGKMEAEKTTNVQKTSLQLIISMGSPLYHFFLSPCRLQASEWGPILPPRGIILHWCLCGMKCPPV